MVTGTNLVRITGFDWWRLRDIHHLVSSALMGFAKDLESKAQSLFMEGRMGL